MRITLLHAMLLATFVAPVARAATPLEQCASLTDDRARLACYDALARGGGTPRPNVPSREAESTPDGTRAAAASQPGSASKPAASGDAAITARDAADTNAAATATAPVASYLDQRWELTPELRNGVLKLRAYRPQYILAHATDRMNENPQSPTRGTAVSDVDLQRLEAKLQLSFRTKLVQDVLGSGTDAWFGYTQQSYWQAANTHYSSPFRETNYEPEFIVLHALPLALGPVRAPYASISYTHQSNGRGESLSRSWNRIIGDVAFESGPWSLHVRPWVRAFDASGANDDNPDIEDYVGRGELVGEYRADGHVVTLRTRHSLRGGERSRGSAQLDWAFPLAGSLSGHVQVFNGFGESLIDYNHRQTTVGVGVSFAD